MSTYIRKCLDIAPTAVITPGPNVANDYRNLRQQLWWPALRATTSHLRLWADWPALQPSGDAAPGGASLEALDAQVDAALADGMKLVMLPYRYPRWATETTHIPAGSVADFEFFTWDRFTRLSQYLEFRAGVRTQLGYKALEYRMPPDGFGPNSRWGRFVAWLWQRYADRLTAFEVVNEPNGQLWPQRSQVATEDFNTRWGAADTTLLTGPAVAEMMSTVDALARRHANPPLLLAPSCSDSLTADAPRTTTRSHNLPTLTTADPFAPSLLTALEARGFAAGDGWVWSFHNYIDAERKMQQAVELRRLLSTRGWAGRRLDGGPELWCTEGGCRLAAMQTRFSPAFGRDLTTEERKQQQALVVTESLSRHHYAKGAGAGIGMLTQYTTYADRNFDSGVLDEVVLGAAVRPSLKAWSDVPEYVAAPIQRAAWRPQL